MCAASSFSILIWFQTFPGVFQCASSLFLQQANEQLKMLNMYHTGMGMNEMKHHHTQAAKLDTQSSNIQVQ